MKDIVIIANFVGGLHGTDNNRFPYLANMLCKNDSVELVASTFCHGEKSCRTNVFNYPFKVTLLEEPGYKKNICLKRFWSHYVWGKNVLKYLMTRKKPDIVYCAVPSLTAPAKVSEYCKKNGIRFVIDIQDLWPEAFQMVFKVPVLSNLLFAPFKRIAEKAYSNADEIVAVSQTYVDRALMVNKKGAKGYAIFLGTNIEKFDDNVRKNFIAKSNGSEVRLAYCGTLGNSYDLTCVFDAMLILNKRGYTNLKFIVMGDGPLRKNFEYYSQKLCLNVVFMGRLPYDKMCGILTSCDIAINPIMHGAAQSIINKHADYAAAGIPVINTQESKEYRTLVESYGMGFICENGIVQELALCIEKILKDDNMKYNMGCSARLCALEKFDRKKSYEKIIELL